MRTRIGQLIERGSSGNENVRMSAMRVEIAEAEMEAQRTGSSLANREKSRGKQIASMEPFAIWVFHLSNVCYRAIGAVQQQQTVCLARGDCAKKHF